MRREVLQGYRVRDKQPVRVVRLMPETPEDEAVIERLDQLGLISMGDSFPEQEEHARLLAKRRRAGLISTPTAEDLDMIRRLEEQGLISGREPLAAPEQRRRTHGERHNEEHAAS